ncbi:MAG: YHS domain-containing (seleno)protein [Ancalomicrobiaceae bacterium]|nr:YHS domain-containing (seleno)protein [Ancalomicrobiaceae bacterium]
MAVLAAALILVPAGGKPADGSESGAADPHASADPHAPKPSDVPLPEPLPPRPTEYPVGHPKKEDKPAVKAPAEAVPKGPPGPDGFLQPMPAPLEAKDGKTEPAKPGTEAEKPTDPSPAWVPPKRYHFLMDTYTGLALGGNDPVAYFVDGMPREGLAEHELDWGGTTWHFANEGNLAAFRQNPEVYAPRFGGRCAFAMSEGLSVEGQPQFFVIHRDRLYLFANAGNRVAFLTDPDGYAVEATRQWAEVVRSEP